MAVAIRRLDHSARPHRSGHKLRGVCCGQPLRLRWAWHIRLYCCTGCKGVMTWIFSVVTYVFVSFNFCVFSRSSSHLPSPFPHFCRILLSPSPKGVLLQLRANTKNIKKRNRRWQQKKSAMQSPCAHAAQKSQFLTQQIIHIYHIFWLECAIKSKPQSNNSEYGNILHFLYLSDKTRLFTSICVKRQKIKFPKKLLTGTIKCGTILNVHNLL